MLNPKLMGGLAWAGAIAIFAVPSAEFVSSQFDSTPSLAITADTAHVVQAASLADDPVDDYLSTGKPLPSYISGAPTPAVAPAPAKPAVVPALTVPAAETAPAPLTTAPLVVPAAESVAPVQTAAAPPSPMPVTMRPTTPSWYEPVPILDEAEVLAREAALRQPPADLPEPVLDQPRIIPSEELEEWDSGSLYDFLARRGLLEGESQSRAVVIENADSYDADGFFLDEGPNTDRRRLPPGEIDHEGDYFIVFPDYR